MLLFAALFAAVMVLADGQQKIADAVRRLGDPAYAVREKASTFLWSCGTDALHAVEEAAKSDDPEVSFRAREIVKKIKSGILPGMSPEVARRIRLYRAGNLEAKRSVILALLNDKDVGIETVLNLVRSEANAAQRKTLLAGMSSDISRLVVTHVVNGKLDEAQALLGLGSEGGDQQMMRSLALMATVRGNIEEEIKTRVGLAETDRWQDVTLMYLYRAAGDLEKAIAVARQVGLTHEALHLQEEAGDWDDLLTTLESKPAPENIEWLGMYLASARLAGNTAKQAATLADIEAYAETHAESSWYAAEALLINDEPERAIRLLRQGGKFQMAAQLLSAQMRFAELGTVVREAEKAEVPQEQLAELKRMLDSVGKGEVRTPSPVAAKNREQDERTPAQWQAVAAEQARLSRAEPESPLPMFLHGFALREAGDKNDGEAIMRLATLLPLSDERKRYEFIQALEKNGLHKEAGLQRDLILRTAPFESWHTGEALRSYAVQRAIVKQDYAAAAFYQERSRLMLLPKNTAILKINGYLRYGWRIAWWHAQDRMSKGEIEEALQYVRKCLEWLPGDITAPIWLCAELDRQDRNEDADELFNGCLTQLEKVCEQYPTSSHFCNQVAWLSARCRRKLNRGLKHADRALELSPDNAAYTDTLAEVHFQLGNRDRAIELIKRCIELEPGIAYFRRQFKRFQTSDPSTDPEE
jgi:hypothetical protein